jgi:hypothetical protein
MCDLERSTAVLAAVFGASLLTASAGTAPSTGPFGVHRAREIAVLARVLEKRLGDMRRTMTEAGDERVRAIPAGGTADFEECGVAHVVAADICR